MNATQEAAPRLPQLAGRSIVTDGGMETDLIFHHGVDLPHFAAFPLVETAQGRLLLTDYYDRYAAIAGRAGAGLMLESPTWRANPDGATFSATPRMRWRWRTPRPSRCSSG